ncbi:hypothetical protein [Desulfurivibrio dismutans]|uniref:hypothetical protein n=1 Tax=Desulfurivibrio dismutans TaxID=1398908 RepID=UPI0023DAD469|nr:hypothetical protein [Desulfurivibrio alkaliphilus]MDF1614689.1 hypothetical protein [Desulfurivibrio alkaliphilus]
MVEELFLAAMEKHRHQAQCLDAEAEIKWRSWLRSGVLPGYLQAMAPNRMKFVGLDPLGRPVLALSTDGESFRLILVPQAVVYHGPTTAEAFSRHLPEGLAAERLPESLSAWLLGGMPLEPEIVAVYREPAGRGYWLEVAEPPRARLLFEPLPDPVGAGVVRRIQLFEPDQRRPTEIIYDDYRPVPGDTDGPGWLLPHRIELDSRRHQGLSLSVVLSDLLADCALGYEDFQLPMPAGYTLETVE